MDLAHRLVHVIYLQRMGFLGAYDIQRRFARQHLDELLGKSGARGHNVILLVEHNPVYTVGLRDKEYPKKTEEELKSTGAEFYRTNRGGLITYHGPGQLVAYPIINLKNFKLGVRDYVCQLQNTLIKTCKDFGVTAKSTDETGVWVEDRKIGAIGNYEMAIVCLIHKVPMSAADDSIEYFFIVFQRKLDLICLAEDSPET